MNNQEPLCIILEHGLGNQLFILFTGISKAIDENRDFEVYPVYNTFRKFFFTNLLKSLLFKVAPIVNLKSKEELYEEPFFHYSPIPNNKKAIKGYFQSPKYFHHNKNKIIDILQLNTFLTKYNFDYKTIGIHLRFGDMSFNQGNHIILKPSYFINAIRKLKQEISDINDYKFIVFGEKEDNEIINDYIDILKNESTNITKFYDIYPNMRDYEELMFMSNCQHLIIANSTFSWFAGYLNDYPNKKVIYPNKWFGILNSSKNDMKDLFMDNWIKVDE
jgi:hypothetical protein